MRILIAVVAALLLSSTLRAQGLVELGFSGEEAVAGGGRVECSITFCSAKEDRGRHTLDLALHVAEHTSAADIAALVSERLREAGASVVAAGAHAPPLGPANLFVENVESIGLRLGNGLACSLTLCEDQPASVRLAPPSDTKQSATLTVVASTIQPHTKEHRRVSIEVSFDEKFASSELATRLAKASIDKGWLAEIEAHDTCRPNVFTDGSQLQGCSFDLKSKGDWRIEVALAPRVAR